jgi:hypothetical protein
MKAAALSLIQSRKFWLTVISLTSSVGAYLSHAITAAQLANIIAASVSVLVVSISVEDHGSKSATTVTTGGPTTVQASIAPPAMPQPSGDSGSFGALKAGLVPAEQSTAPSLPPGANTLAR